MTLTQLSADLWVEPENYLMFEELFIAIATSPAPDWSSQACRISVRVSGVTCARPPLNLTTCGSLLPVHHGGVAKGCCSFHGDERPDQTQTRHHQETDGRIRLQRPTRLTCA